MRVALKDPASALSAGLPTALMLWVTHVRRQAPAKTRLAHRAP
ncbi:hypothetical protein ACFYNZ_09310 [Streptomyces kebangsaanensis]|uniref:Uncharacterized protein n=1 Tax=Streptomyces kebangsaanensis TaxID=864058 RepID=A0ABW6KP82_9ACTN